MELEEPRSQGSATGSFLSQVNPVHILAPCFQKLGFNIIIPLSSYEGFHPFRFSNKPLYTYIFLISSMRVITCPASSYNRTVPS
jgi:hypothetical protein